MMEKHMSKGYWPIVSSPEKIPVERNLGNKIARSSLRETCLWILKNGNQLGCFKEMRV